MLLQNYTRSKTERRLLALPTCRPDGVRAREWLGMESSSVGKLLPFNSADELALRDRILVRLGVFKLNENRTSEVHLFQK